MFDLITIGDVVIDTHVKIDDASLECGLDNSCKLCLSYADKIPIAESFQSLGGNAANVACAGVKLGLKTAILTTLGMDSNSVLAKQELDKNKVVTDFVKMDSKTKTRYSVVLSFKGERTILSYHQKRNYYFPAKLPMTDWIYYTSLSDNFLPLQAKVFGYLKKHKDTKLAFNPGSYQIKKSLPAVLKTIKKADILILNLEEAERVLKTTLKKEKTVINLIKKLLKIGAKEVVVTDGDKGAWVANSKEMWFMVIYPEKVAAKTGAGDAFSAGYLAARIQNKTLVDALRWGTANSAGVVTKVGAQNGLLSKAGVLGIIKKYPRIRPVKIK